MRKLFEASGPVQSGSWYRYQDGLGVHTIRGLEWPVAAARVTGAGLGRPWHRPNLRVPPAVGGAYTRCASSPAELVAVAVASGAAEAKITLIFAMMDDSLRTIRRAGG